MAHEDYVGLPLMDTLNWGELLRDKIADEIDRPCLPRNWVHWADRAGPGIGKSAITQKAWDYLSDKDISKQLNVEETETMRHVHTRTFYGYDDLEECSDQQIFNFIRSLQNEHTDLDEMAKISSKAVKRQKKITKQIAKLVKYVDNR